MTQVGRPSAEAEPTDAGAHCSTGNEYDLPILLDQPDELLGDGGDAIVVEGAVFVGQHAGADLHDDGAGGRGDFLPDRVEHTG